MIVDDDDAGMFRVDRRAYTDPGVFARERTQIFEKCWIYAAHASEVPNPGDFVSRTVAGRPLIVARGQDGQLRALLNTCPHRGAIVCAQHSGNTRVFTCPYHAWSFDLQGRLRGLPGRDAYAAWFDPEELNLTEVRAESYREFVFINLDRGAASLADFLGAAKQQIDLVVDQGFDRGMEVVPGSQKFGIRANWKLLGENSIDTYHVLSLHRRYMEYVEDSGVRTSRPHGRTTQLGNGHAVSVSEPPVAAKPVACWGPPMPVSKKQAMLALQRRLVDSYGKDRAHAIGQTYRQLLIFPNLALIDTCATTIRTWDPVAIDEMRVTAWALAPRDQDPGERALALQSFLTFFGPGGFASPDDIEILEGVQRGFANHERRWVDCSRGMARSAPELDDELPIRAFYRQWAKLLDGATGGTR